MPTSEQLTLGYISYLNCVPFFQYLRDQGFGGRLVPGVPSSLNRMLQLGELDASPSSSFEYALHAEKYCLLPDFSISSTGPVNSVLLFSSEPPEMLVDQTIALTSESATSINLLRVLLLEYYGHQVVLDEFPDETVEAVIYSGRPGLLIGDRAMAQALDLPKGVKIYDLGQMWYDKTGLPFVFALWIVRKDSAQRKAEQLKLLMAQLHKSLKISLSDLRCLAKDAGFSDQKIDYCAAYWHGIDYSLSSAHQKGLELFFRLCAKYNYLADAPDLSFIQ